MSILDKHRHGCLGIVNTVVNIKFAEFFFVSVINGYI